MLGVPELCEVMTGEFFHMHHNSGQKEYSGTPSVRSITGNKKYYLFY